MEITAKRWADDRESGSLVESASASFEAGWSSCKLVLCSNMKECTVMCGQTCMADLCCRLLRQTSAPNFCGRLPPDFRDRLLKF